MIPEEHALDDPEKCPHEYIGLDMKPHSAAVKWSDGKYHCKFCGQILEDQAKE